jgi:hypothetical protein
MPQGKEILAMEIVLDRMNLIDKNPSGKQFRGKKQTMRYLFCSKRVKTYSILITIPRAADRKNIYVLAFLD